MSNILILKLGFIKNLILIISHVLCFLMFIGNILVLIIHINGNTCFNFLEYLLPSNHFLENVKLVEYIYESRYHLLVCQLLILIPQSYGFWSHSKKKNTKISGVCSIIAYNITIIIFIGYLLSVNLLDYTIPKKIEDYFNMRILEANNKTVSMVYIKNFMNESNCCSFDYCSINNTDTIDCLTLINNDAKNVIWYVTMISVIPIINILIIYVGIQLILQIKNNLQNKKRDVNEKRADDMHNSNLEMNTKISDDSSLISDN